MTRLKVFLILSAILFLGLSYSAYSQSLESEIEVYKERLSEQEIHLQNLKALLIMAEQGLLTSRAQIQNLRKQLETLQTNSSELMQELESLRESQLKTSNYITTLSQQSQKQKQELTELLSLFNVQLRLIDDLKKSLDEIEKKNKGMSIGLGVGVPLAFISGLILGIVIYRAIE